jgi:hypothetical protein
MILQNESGNATETIELIGEFFFPVPGTNHGLSGIAPAAIAPV